MRIDIYDVRGRKAETLMDQDHGSGAGFVTWRAGSEGRVPPGLYFACLSAGGRESVKKIVYAP